MSLAVVVVGPDGRLGRVACSFLEADDEFALVGCVRSQQDLAQALTELVLSRPDVPVVGLDLTVAGLGAEHGHAMIGAGVRPVIGTSGVTPEEVEALDAHAREAGLGGLVVPNFSLGLVALQRMLGIAAQSFEHAALVESHYLGKRDAPSGTALDLERRLQEQWRFRPTAEVSVHSLRLPGSPARHRLSFARDGEELTLEHQVSSPKAYLPGIRLALKYAARALGVECGLDAIGDLPGSEAPRVGGEA